MQYFLTYNSGKFQYVVWNNQQVVCRISDRDKNPDNRLKVIEFFQLEYTRSQEPLEIHKISSAGTDLEGIMKAIESIRKKQ